MIPVARLDIEYCLPCQSLGLMIKASHLLVFKISVRILSLEVTCLCIFDMHVEQGDSVQRGESGKRTEIDTQ